LYCTELHGFNILQSCTIDLSVSLIGNYLSTSILTHRTIEGKEDDKTIYGNIQHQRLGAMGNAEERWESYWKTETILRTADQKQSPKK